MNSNDNLPLIYFQELLERDKSKFLIKTFISDFLKNSEETNFEIENETGTIKYFGQFYDDDGNPQEVGLLTYDFKTFFENKIDIEIKNSKHILNATISELARNNISSLEYLDLNRRILKNLIINAELHYSNFHFVKEKLAELVSFVEGIMNIKNKKRYLSYRWDFSDETNTYEKLSKLYKLLQYEHQLIETGKNGQIDHLIPEQIDHRFRFKMTT